MDVKRMTKLFTEADLKRIESAVGAAEKGTSGEIVTLVARSSGDYRWVRWAWASGGLALASAGLWAVSLRQDWEPAILETLAWQLGAALAASFLPFLDPLFRLTVPRKIVARQVHREALASFTAAGLHTTRDRTGILIYISELERRVEILADKGIHDREGNDYWRAECDRIVKAIHEGRATDGLCETIRSMAHELVRHFPARPDDTDELCNKVLVGPQGTQPPDDHKA